MTDWDKMADENFLKKCDSLDAALKALMVERELCVRRFGTGFYFEFRDDVLTVGYVADGRRFEFMKDYGVER